MVRQEFRTTWLGDSKFRKAKLIDDSQNFEHISTNTWQTTYYVILPITPNVGWSTTTKPTAYYNKVVPLSYNLV